MRIIKELNEEEKQLGLVCEVAGCGKDADLYVTDDTEDGAGYICKECNDKDEAEGRKGWKCNRDLFLEALRTEPTAVPQITPCKGVKLRGYRSQYYRAERGEIAFRQGVRLLKRASCPGCSTCEWVIPVLSESIADGYLIWPDEGIEDGALYEAKIINEEHDWETQLVDSYDVTLVKVKEGI